MTTRTTYDAAPAGISKATVAWLTAAVLAAGCADSPPGAGDGGAAGQAGSVSSGGAVAGGKGPVQTGGSHAGAGNGGRAGAAAIGGTTTTAGQATTGGSSSGTGGSSAGAAGGAGGAGMGGGAGATSAGAGRGGGGGGPATGPCSPARPHAAGDSTVNLESGGMNRSYLLHIPPGYDGTKPLPLVFDVHGYTSFASEQMMRSKWDKMADKEGFVLIDPEASTIWNAGSCCGGNTRRRQVLPRRGRKATRSFVRKNGST